MYEMFKFNFINMSPNNSIPNQISNDEDDVWHPQKLL